MKGIPIYIRDPRNYRKRLLVGRMLLSPRGRVFLKIVERKRHFMRVVKGYGIQKEVFDKYLRGKKGLVKIYEKDTGKWLVASIQTWTKHSSTQNFGDGKQVFLSERFMHGADDFNREVVVEKKE